LIVPSGCADLLSKRIQHVLETESEGSGKDKWTVKFKNKVASPLPRGACVGLNLAKLDITLTFMGSDCDDEEEFIYELDLRELRKDETYREDPKCRDFKINSMYYSVMEEKPLDITNVGQDYLVLQGHQKQRHQLRQRFRQNFWL
jgi:hypothetical protein